MSLRTENLSHEVSGALCLAPIRCVLHSYVMFVAAAGVIGEALQSFSIVGLYITFVLAVGRFIRAQSSDLRLRIPFENLPNCDQYVGDNPEMLSLSLHCYTTLHACHFFRKYRGTL